MGVADTGVLPWNMPPASSLYAIFRTSDWSPVVAEPIGLCQCLRIQPPKVLPKKRYPEEEQWEYLEEGSLKKSRSACVCMTCQHFNYCCDKHCHTLLTYHVRQRLIPHGEHLTSRCPLWMPRREKEIGWCPEAA